MDLDAAKQLRKEIDKAVTAGGDGVPPESMSAVKGLVRADPAHAPKVALESLLHHLKAAHSQERLAALIIADVLFTRSHAFRQGLVRHMDTVVMHAAGHSHDHPLPPPEKYARRLREEFGSMLTRWNEAFGAKHKGLSLAFGFVKSKMQCVGHEASRRQHAERERDLRKAEQVASARKSLGMFRKQLPRIQEHFAQARKALRSLVSFPGELSGDGWGAGFQSVLDSLRDEEEEDDHDDEPLEDEDEDDAEFEATPSQNALRSLGLSGMESTIEVTLTGSGLMERVKVRGREEEAAAAHGHAPESVIESLCEARRNIDEVAPQLRRWCQQMKSLLSSPPGGGVVGRSSGEAAAQHPASARLSGDEMRLAGSLLSALDEVNVILSKCDALGVGCEHGGRGQGWDGGGHSGSECEMEEVDVFAGPEAAQDAAAETDARTHMRETSGCSATQAADGRWADEGLQHTGAGLGAEAQLGLAKGTGLKLPPADDRAQKPKKRRRRGDALAAPTPHPAKAAMEKGRKVLRPASQLCRHREVAVASLRAVSAVLMCFPLQQYRW